MSMTAEELQAQADAKAKVEPEAKAKAEAEAKAKAVADAKAAPPTYEPKDPNKVNAQADFYAKNPNDLYALLKKVEEKSGIKIIEEPDTTKPDTEARVARLEIENAKLKAATKYKLSEDDVAILDGSPEQIEAKAKYLAERIEHAKTEAASASAEAIAKLQGKPDEKGGPPLPKQLPFNKNIDPKVLEQRAMDDLTKAINTGQGPKTRYEG